MNVFITGGTGFIGQPLTGQLLARGWQVTALVRQPDSPPARLLVNMGAHCVVGDITDLESMRVGMRGADIVIHNAGCYEMGVRGEAKKQMQAINVQGTQNVLSLAEEMGVRRVVYVSSVMYWGGTGRQPCGETFTRQSPIFSLYEQTKAAAHEIALDYQQRGSPLVIACPAPVIGANDHSAYGYFLRMYLNGILPGIGWAPEAINALVEVQDLAEGIALATERGRLGETYIFAGEAHTRREFIEVWKTRPGGIIPRVWLPTWLAMILFGLLEPLVRGMGLPAFISRETFSSGAMDLNYSSEKARRELGWVYRPAQEAWLQIIDDEIALLKQREKRNLFTRLKPVEP